MKNRKKKAGLNKKVKKAKQTANRKGKNPPSNEKNTSEIEKKILTKLKGFA